MDQIYHFRSQNATEIIQATGKVVQATYQDTNHNFSQSLRRSNWVCVVSFIYP